MLCNLCKTTYVPTVFRVYLTLLCVTLSVHKLPLLILEKSLRLLSRPWLRWSRVYNTHVLLSSAAVLALHTLCYSTAS
jgi:hypothetical protein